MPEKGLPVKGVCLSYGYMFTTTDLFGKFHSPRQPLAAAKAQLPASPNELARLFKDAFPAHWLSPTEEGPNSRQRIFSLRLTFWTFLWQVLTPGSPCADAVLKVVAWWASLGRHGLSPDTSPYCQARARLSLATLRNVLRATFQKAEQRVRSRWRFHDRDVIVGDGTTLSAPDTPENQRAFPQSSSQKEGCGFPLIKLLGLFSLASGALLAFRPATSTATNFNSCAPCGNISKRATFSWPTASSATTSPSPGWQGGALRASCDSMKSGRTTSAKASTWANTTG